MRRENTEKVERKRPPNLFGDLKGFTKQFLGGVWHGMGPDVTKKRRPRK